MSTLLAAWNILSWLRRQRTEMETNAEAYLTDERARAWRKEAEVIFKALAEGYSETCGADGVFRKLPKPVRWFFAHTKADNHLGRFGQTFLKSHWLEVYRTH